MTKLDGAVRSAWRREIQAYRADPGRCAVAYVCAWNSLVDEVGDGKREWRRILPPAFDQFFSDQQMFANLAARLGKPRPLVPVVVGHGNTDRYPAWPEPVGRWVEFHKHDYGLLGVAEFDDTPAGARAMQAIWAKGFPGWSMYFAVDEERPAGMGKLALPVVEVTQARLIHAGPVLVPADPGAITVYAHGEVMVPWDRYPQALETVADLLGWPGFHHPGGGIS